MLNFTKKVNRFLQLRPQITYSIFDTITQSSLNQDQQAKLQKIFKKFENNQQSLTPQKLGSPMPRGQLPVPFVIDGEEKIFQVNQSQKLLPRTCSSKVQLGAGRLKSQEDWQSQLSPLFYEWRPRSIHKWGTLARTQAPSFKITKIGINSYKTKLQKALKELSEKVKIEVELQILHAMVGDTLPNELREKKLQDLRKGHYNDQIITIMPSGYRPNLQIDESYFPQKALTKTVKQIRYYQRLKSSYTSLDLQKLAIKHVQEDGIVFLDQIDKLAVPQGPLSQVGKGVSTEGVQRDLLPLIQGTTVNTKYGDVKTDHILFIASGSFSMAKVEDLIPELLGRLPIRVGLSPISKPQLVRILKQPQYNLIMQQVKLLQTEKVKLTFTEDSIEEIAEQAYQMNTNTQNLGARRLHSIIEKIVEQISFAAPSYKDKQFVIDQAYVRQKLQNQIKSIDLKKYLI